METISRLLLNYMANALWILIVVASVAWLCGRCLRQAHARRIYLLWLASLIVSVLLPIAGVVRAETNARTVRNDSAAGAAEHAASIPSTHSGRIFWLTTSGSSRKQQLSLAPLLRTSFLLFYCAFLLRGAFRLCVSWKQTKSIRRRATVVTFPTRLHRAAEQCFRAFAMRPSAIAVSSELSSPCTVGTRRPLLMFPECFLADASEEEFTSALCHELAHIRRRDFFWNVLCELLLIPICFHPIAAFIKRRLDCAREIACDEMAAELSLTRIAYARSLLSLAKGILARNDTAVHNYALGLFDSDTLEERIMALLNRKSVSRTMERVVSFAASALLVAACGLTSAFSLQVAAPKADAGDIRPFVGTWEAKFDGKTFQTIHIDSQGGKVSGSANHISIAMDGDGNLTDARAHEGSDQITAAKLDGKVLRLTCTGKAHMNVNGGTSDAETTQYEMKLTGSDQAEIRPVVDGAGPPELKPWKLERVKK